MILAISIGVLLMIGFNVFVRVTEYAEWMDIAAGFILLGVLVLMYWLLGLGPLDLAVLAIVAGVGTPSLDRLLESRGY